MELKHGLARVLKTTRPDSGIYILELYANTEFTISAKKFLGKSFSKGFYYYIGSAQKNLRARINRHIQRRKKVHWHIDYLTTHPSVEITNHFVFPYLTKEYESIIANNFENLFDCKMPVLGFGNSDTKGTKSHLFYNIDAINNSDIHNYVSRLSKTNIK